MLKSRQDYEKQHQEDSEKIKNYEYQIHNYIHKLNIYEIETKRLKAVIAERESEIEILKKEAEHVNKLKKDYQKAVSEFYWSPRTNERGAGRKTKLTESVLRYIKKYRDEGKSQSEIAKIMGLSTGLVNKACNMLSKS